MTQISLSTTFLAALVCTRSLVDAERVMQRLGLGAAFCLRLTHVLLMVFIAGQAWLVQLCPLTVLEQDLRRIAGEVGYRESFIEYWLSRLLYWEALWISISSAFVRLDVIEHFTALVKAPVLRDQLALGQRL